MSTLFKIIFKCVNSTVGLIFNEKVVVMFVGSVNSVWVHCLWEKSKFTAKKKKKKEEKNVTRKRRKHRIQTAP